MGMCLDAPKGSKFEMEIRRESFVIHFAEDADNPDTFVHLEADLDQLPHLLKVVKNAIICKASRA